MGRRQRPRQTSLGAAFDTGGRRRRDGRARPRHGGLPPNLRNPVHVAHQTATVDQVSGGRFNFGIGVGIGPDVKREYANLGHEYDTRGRRMDELLEVVSALWSGEPIDYDGEFFHLEDASIGFGPVSGGSIYIPTLGFDPIKGFPQAIENRLVKYSAGWLPVTMPPEEYASSLADVYDLLEANGRHTDHFDPRDVHRRDGRPGRRNRHRGRPGVLRPLLARMGSPERGRDPRERRLRSPGSRCRDDRRVPRGRRGELRRSFRGRGPARATRTLQPGNRPVDDALAGGRRTRSNRGVDRYPPR